MHPAVAVPPQRPAEPTAHRLLPCHRRGRRQRRTAALTRCRVPVLVTHVCSGATVAQQGRRACTRLGVAPRAAPCAHQRCVVRKGKGCEAAPHRPVTTLLITLLATIIAALTAALVAALAALAAATLAPCGADARQRTHIVTRVERVERWQQIVHRQYRGAVATRGEFACALCRESVRHAHLAVPGDAEGATWRVDCRLDSPAVLCRAAEVDQVPPHLGGREQPHLAQQCGDRIGQ